MTVRITNAKSAFAYLDSVGASYERSDKSADKVVERGSCDRCGGSGHYSFNLVDGTMCYGCRGSGGHYVRHTDVVSVAREVKTRKAKAARAEKKRLAEVAAREKRVADAKALAEEALAALRPFFSDDSTYVENWADFCAAIGDFCAAKGVRAERELNYKVRDLRKAEVEAAREAQRKAEAATSEHVGTVGERRDFVLTLVTETCWDGAYGRTYLYVFRDADGNVFSWKASRGHTFERGETYALKATVKGHGEYKGVAQTEINRGKLLKAA